MAEVTERQEAHGHLVDLDVEEVDGLLPLEDLTGQPLLPVLEAADG